MMMLEPAAGLGWVICKPITSAHLWLCVRYFADLESELCQWKHVKVCAECIIALAVPKASHYMLLQHHIVESDCKLL